MKSRVLNPYQGTLKFPFQFFVLARFVVGRAHHGYEHVKHDCNSKNVIGAD